MCLAIFLFGIHAVDVIPDDSFVLSFGVVGGTEVEFVVGYSMLPFAIYCAPRGERIVRVFGGDGGSRIRFLMLTSKEHKAIDTNLLVMFDADLVDQPFHVSQATEGRHEIAIAITTLANVTCRGAVDVELGIVKDILYTIHGEHTRVPNVRSRPAGVLSTYSHALDTFWLHRISQITQTVQTIPLSGLEIPFDVEVGVAVLLVQPPALPDDPVDVSFTLGPGLFVGPGRPLARDCPMRSPLGLVARIGVVGQ